MANEQSTPKIALKATLKAPITLKTSKPLTGTPPPTTKPSIFEADDDEGPEKDAKTKRLVTGFDQRLGAILHKNETKKEVKKEYIIPSVPNRDWKVQISDPRKQTAPSKCTNEDEKLTFGLNVVAKQKPADAAGVPKDTDSKTDLTSPQVDEDDEEDLIEPISEQEAYNRDVYTRPDAPDLEAYNRMPVEEFGAALLRGMGWKSTVPDNTPKDRADEDAAIEQLFKRPALLGLGAKEVKDSSTEDKPLKAGMRKKEREYVPLLKVSKATGKVITDSEQDSDDKSGLETHGSSNTSRVSRETRPRRLESGRYESESNLRRSYEDRHTSSSRSKRHSDDRDRYDRHSNRSIRSDRDSRDRYSSSGWSSREERGSSSSSQYRGLDSGRRHERDRSERKRGSESDEYRHKRYKTR
jgi:hypothetical protein